MPTIPTPDVIADGQLPDAPAVAAVAVPVPPSVPAVPAQARAGRKQFKHLSPASKQVVTDLFCRAHAFSTTSADPMFPAVALPNETPADFVERMAQEWIVARALEHRAREAMVAAQAAALDADLS
jgi:hypothetical protein